MQFKILAFLSILSILFFTGCGDKDNNNELSQKEETLNPKVKLLTTKNINLHALVEEETVIFDEYKDKILLINFFATWCPPCKAEVPNLIKLQENYKNDFQVISVLLEKNKTNSEISEFIKDFNINYPVTNTDTNYELADKFGGIKSIPTMFMIDKQGNIFQKYVGLVPLEMLETDIKKVLQK